MRSKREAAVAAIRVVRRRFRHLDMRFRQFVDEAARQGRVPQAVDAAVGGENRSWRLRRARVRPT